MLINPRRTVPGKAPLPPPELPALPPPRRRGAVLARRALPLCVAAAGLVASSTHVASAATWSGYTQLGSNRVQAVAATSSQPLETNVFVIGTDNAVWTKTNNFGIWTGYSQLGTNQVKAVAATSPAAGTIDLFVIGTDNAVWTKHFQSGTWSGYSQLGTNQVKGLAASATVYSPTVYMLDVLVIGTDDALWVKSQTECGADCPVN